MSSDFLQILQGFTSSIWTLFTSFKIPGLNFSPAVLLFGILSFHLAIKMLSGIFNVTTSNAGRKKDEE